MTSIRTPAGPAVAFLREAQRPIMFLCISVGILACLLALAVRIALGDTLDWQQLAALAGAVAMAMKHQDQRSDEVKTEMTLAAAATPRDSHALAAADMAPPRGGVVA